MTEQEIREAALLFDKNPDLEVLKADRSREVMWGGCYYNHHTKQIDRIYSKKKDVVYPITYHETRYRDALLVKTVDQFYNEIELGMIKKDFTQYRELSQGGRFFLEGIKKSMEIIKMREEERKRLGPDPWFD